ncbi:MAG: glycoside hydrolase family 3 C-terminal domain-containing protein [Bryobacteraceae bacterium]|nr:glycoside hydrolase family 3 C-terminal domain-containing protein [Bryobacteraceae bacterium]
MGIGLHTIGWLATAALAASAADYPFRDPSLPFEQRVEDLLSRLTLEEKIAQLMNDAPAIERLGVPAYNWWNECLHGVGRAGVATVFPQAIGLAATWDAELMERVAGAIADEARAKHHEFVRRGKRNIYQGLTFWTPNINLFRDPRWGRGMETYGEDPHLTGRLAAAFIRGLQGNHPRYLKTVATAKHFAVHSGPEPLRHSFDARVSVADLYESYLPHFETAVREAGAASVMCAYNRVNGEPACASKLLLEDILRGQWGFTGYVVSDCGAIRDIYTEHRTAPTPEAGSAEALRRGTDLNCGTEYMHLANAIRQGLASEADVDRALRRLLMARFRLGMFDPPEMVPFAQIPYSVNNSPEHRRLALEAARKSIVLLKNDRGLLPLPKSLRTIAVIGPNADEVTALLGNYHGDPLEPVTPLAGIRRKLQPTGTRVLYARGSDLAEGLPHFEVVPQECLLPPEHAGGGNGLLAEYFPSASFDGRSRRPRELTHPSTGRPAVEAPKPVPPLFTRVDAQVNFVWRDGAPRADLNDDDFGVRWTGYLVPRLSGRYSLGAIGMNAYTLYLDDKPIARANHVHERAYVWSDVDLEAGRRYRLRLEFHHYVNDADIQLVWAPPRPDPLREAIEAARQADVAVVVLGLSPRLEGEEMRVPVAGFKGGDRETLDLPATQHKLLEAICATGKPVVLVLMNGSALAVNWARQNVPAIVEAWYPGEAGGDAIADVLFGDYNPAGRLPVTFYRSVDQLPPFTDYSMKGRTYRYFSGEPLFPFGFGLSYTRFAYGRLRAPDRVRPGQPITVEVEVRNVGGRAGEEVVQAYVTALDRTGFKPIRTLAAFARIALGAGESRTVKLQLDERAFSEPGPDGRLRWSPGRYQLWVGGKQPGFRGALDAPTTQVVSARLRVLAPEGEGNR